MTGYGLEELGIRTENTIVSNEYLETRYPNIFVAGDVAGPYQFTHTAAHQGWYAAVNGLFGNFKKFRADYSVIPHCTFTDPEVARVGINENDAKQQGIAYEVTRYGIDDLDRAIADGKDHGFIKILTVPGKDRILGVTIVGEHGGDLLAEFVLAMKHGLGLNKILGTIHTYPTLSEANKYAAGEWKRAHVPHNLLNGLKNIIHSDAENKDQNTEAGKLSGSEFSHENWDKLLEKYVVPINDGTGTQFDYRRIQYDKILFNQYLQKLSKVNKVDFDAWGKNYQLAFLINAYNAWTVELIIRKDDLPKSIKDLGSLFKTPWQNKFVPLLGETRSLDNIEHDLIRGSGRYNEPRIHFAVNCASIGCPALLNEAYDGKKIDSQLDKATRSFLRDRTRNGMRQNYLEISPIFDWYEEDFKMNGSSLTVFLGKYADELGMTKAQAADLKAGKIKIRYTEYDWDLNIVK
ncbi:hypothetical protein CHS0354_002045 [Potamilus streckersoni]|uniref:Dihydrolipoamide dehydrogenase n=1 Tax=Potamilus streckersoni TaxID=2493646 RepID=A0AAE0T5R1_9BIVA|nr:hypothetical protein CHS0354_002045 [Potamilus streckersoni]